VLSESPLPGVELRFIAFGAEEQGLIGAHKLVKENLLPPDTLVLNMDMVGAGSQAYVIEGNGILRKTKTSARLNQALTDSIQRAGLKPKIFWAPFAGHDHIPLMRAKMQATTFSFDTPGADRLGQRIAKLFGLPNAKTRLYRHIHTSEDISDHLVLANIERAGAIVLDFVKTI
jgi:Zn-dependent M28 family amino/carboxypeptidase